MPITINGTTGVAGVAGSAATPAIQGTDTNTGVAFPAADTVTISTNGTERVRVDSSGNFGVGTNNPGSKLDVVGSGSLTQARVRTTDGNASRITLENTARGWSITNYGTAISPNGAFVIADETAALPRMVINTSGNVGIGTATPTYKLDISGQGQFTNTGAGAFTTAHIIATATTGNVCIALHTSGSAAPMLRNERGAGEQIDSVNGAQTNFASFRASAFTVISDYRIKENFEPLSNPIGRLRQLNPLRFNFTETSMMWNNGRVVDGFIAHEVAAVVPEAVTGEKDAVKDDGSPLHQGLDQAKLIPLLTAALQEAVKKIESLEERIVLLEAK